MSELDNGPVAGALQETYIVSEGKKRGSTRDVRPEAAHDRYYTVCVYTRAMPSSPTTGTPTKC